MSISSQRHYCDIVGYSKDIVNKSFCIAGKLLILSVVFDASWKLLNFVKMYLV